MNDDLGVPRFVAEDCRSGMSLVANMLKRCVRDVNGKKVYGPATEWFVEDGQEYDLILRGEDKESIEKWYNQ